MARTFTHHDGSIWTVELRYGPIGGLDSATQHPDDTESTEGSPRLPVVFRNTETEEERYGFLRVRPEEADERDLVLALNAARNEL